MARISSVIAVAAVAIGVLLLAACSGKAGAPVPTATASSSTSTPSRSASADPLSTVDAILVGGDGLHLQHGTETVALLDYRTDPAQAIAALTAVLGAPTATSEAGGTNHTVPSTLTEFGGLRVVDHHYGAPVTYDYLVTPAWSVMLSAAAAGDVALGTTVGVAVGEPYENAQPVAGSGQSSATMPDGSQESWVLVERSPGSPEVEGGAVGVLVGARPWPGPISWISAPAMFGGA
ncbi:hypothetical protein KNO15_02320 [Leifsonia shinshuensis]|uniref:hypothetical protein n=1 Tax=Leifsonia shinshuensis TaxID=150026 RepID=UPI001F50613B|nr:hypothetical protein [Leifsonia shinshuensis]MCI0155528.1 hypothetical protein [Leifsonia shinshuensis]